MIIFMLVRISKWLVYDKTFKTVSVNDKKPVNMIIYLFSFALRNVSES